MGKFDRIIWIVLDSVGIGPLLPDRRRLTATTPARTTLGHIAEYTRAPCEFPRS